MKNLEKTVELAAKADLRVAIWGRHGVGKTAIIEQLNDKRSESGDLLYYVKTIILSQSDPLVLGGFPGREKIGVSVDGVETYMTTFAKPQWIMDCESAEKRGLQVIVFLDEFNRADVYAHNTAMRLVNEKEICGHKLPASTCFIAAMNPETAGDAAVNELTDPMVDRWCHVAVNTDAKFWLNWATAKDSNGNLNVDSTVSDFIANAHERLNGFSMETMFENQVQKRILPTERSVHAVSRLLTVLANENGGKIDAKTVSGNRAAYSMIIGLCGRTWATEYVTFLEKSFNHPFTIDEMMGGKKTVLNRAAKLKDAGQTQVLIVSLDRACEEIPALFDNNAKKIGKKLAGFWKFVNECPVDSQQAFWSAEAGGATSKKFWLQALTGDVPQFVKDALKA